MQLATRGHALLMAVNLLGKGFMSDKLCLKFLVQFSKANFKGTLKKDTQPKLS